MKTLCLVSCSSKKKNGQYPAEELYDSAMFDGARNFAANRADNWRILSAKHHLLAPKDVIPTYDLALKNMMTPKRLEWARQTFRQIESVTKPDDQIIFLAGHPYREFLVPMLKVRGHPVAAPMAHLGIGKQIAWLQKIARESTRIRDVDRLYELLCRLANGVGGTRQLGKATAKSKWPTRGIYLFFDPSEYRMSSPFSQRIVRVGTHAVSVGSKTTLWHRLRTHRGAANLTGNHRGSIFRLHVGNALIARNFMNELFQNWGIGQSATKTIRYIEDEMEQLVSEYMGQMSVLWIDVDDIPGPDSDRAYLERNLIGLLSGPSGAIDLASREWLGLQSPRQEISQSGLWNLNYLDYKYDPKMLDILDAYVDITIGKRTPTGVSLAPSGWRTKAACYFATQQLSLI